MCGKNATEIIRKYHQHLGTISDFGEILMVSVNLWYAIHYFAALIRAQMTMSTFHRLLQFSEAFHLLLTHTYAGVSVQFLPECVFRNLTACEAPTWLQPFSFSNVQSEWNVQTHGLYTVHELLRCTYIFYHRLIVSLLFNIFTIRCRLRPSAQVLFAYIASPIIKFTYPPPDCTIRSTREQLLQERLESQVRLFLVLIQS